MSLIHSLNSFALCCIFLASLQFLRADAAGVKFTTPAPGATLPAGNFAVNWTDSGGVPGLDSLTTYTLTLFVGGITPNNSKSIATLSPPNALVSSLGLVVNIPPDVGQSIQNGFYLCMTSNATNGDQVVNYSDRFTLVQLTGKTDAQYVQGAASTVGDSNVPGDQIIVNSQQPPPTSVATTNPSSTAASPNTSGTSTATGTPAGQKDYSIGSGQLAALLAGTLCAIVLFLILIVLGLIWWRKKRKARREQEKETKDEAVWSGKIELPGEDMASVRAVPLVELSPDQERYEVETPIERHEAHSDVRFELEGDWAGWEAAARRSQAYDPTR